MSEQHGQHLAINRVGKSFTIGTGVVQALGDINLEVKTGEFLSIVGASGCGKSTLLRLIGGLEEATEGDISLGAERIAGPKLDRGMVFQEARLLPWLTVEENVAFGCRKGTAAAEKKSVVAEHIALVGL